MLYHQDDHDEYKKLFSFFPTWEPAEKLFERIKKEK
jgi:hypothetical protein